MQVYYFAAARAAAGVASEVIMDPPGTLRQLIIYLTDIHPGTTTGGTSFAKVLEISTFLGDGSRLDIDADISQITRIDVLPPFAGG